MRFYPLCELAKRTLNISGQKIKDNMDMYLFIL